MNFCQWQRRQAENHRIRAYHDFFMWSVGPVKCLTVFGSEAGFSRYRMFTGVTYSHPVVLLVLENRKLNTNRIGLLLYSMFEKHRD